MRFRKLFLLTIIFGLFSSVSVAQQAKSDYEIQQSFKKQYADYQNQLEEVSAPDSAQQLIESIKGFNQEYRDHAELLDKALYPESYEEKMSELKKASVRALDRAETITEQRKKLKKMETKLTTYEEDLSKLDNQTDSLKTAIRKSTESEKQLSGMVREYRQRLEKRDELILTFIDSMIVTYQDMDLEALQELEDYNGQKRIKSNNALKLIHDITAENLQILQRNASNLVLEDYMRMAEVNYQFEQMWDKLGSKIEEVYDGDNAETLANNVSRNIEKWNSQLKSNTIDALNEYFAQKELKVDTFESSDQFYSSLNTYLDRKIKQSKENKSEENYEELQQFKEFWNPVQMDWTNNLTYANVLNKDEMSTLNKKVDDWTKIAQPRSNNILVYLLGASVLLAVALGVMLIREKKNKQSA